MNMATPPQSASTFAALLPLQPMADGKCFVRSFGRFGLASLSPRAHTQLVQFFLVREEPKNITTRLDTIRLLDRGSFTSDFLAEDRPCCTFSSSPAIQRHKEGILLGGFNLQLHVLQCFAQCSGHSLTGSCFERPSQLLNVFYTEVTKCSNTAKQSETCPQVTCSQVFALQTTPSRLRASTD